MCGPFKSTQNILRLLEIIFSTLALVIAMCRGGMMNPWGTWCMFVWVFCIIVPLVFIVMEAMSWNVLLAAFLPSWDDLTCGLTMLCAVMIISASVIFAVLFVCHSCIVSIFCLIFSLIATVIFLVDAVMQKMKCPSGYLSNLRGLLRMSEAFTACIILTAAADYFLGVEYYFRPAGMIWCVFVVALCLLVTVIIIILHLLKILQTLIPFGLGLIDLVFNVVAVLLYLTAVICWAVYGFRHPIHSEYHRYHCYHCVYNDLIIVTVGCVVNIILYIVDLVLSILKR